MKFKSWENLPQEVSAVVEAAYTEGRANSGIYQQRRSKTRWDDYCINFSTMQQANMVSGRKRDARRQIVASDWRPTEVTTELCGVWREPGEDTRQQHNKGNKIMQMQHEDDDSGP